MIAPVWKFSIMIVTKTRTKSSIYELLYKYRLTDKESVWCKEGIISADIWLRFRVFQIAAQGIYLFNFQMVDEV